MCQTLYVAAGWLDLSECRYVIYDHGAERRAAPAVREEGDRPAVDVIVPQGISPGVPFGAGFTMPVSRRTYCPRGASGPDLCDRGQGSPRQVAPAWMHCRVSASLLTCPCRVRVACSGDEGTVVKICLGDDRNGSGWRANVTIDGQSHLGVFPA
jgi:hypothetical protein